MQGGPQTWLVKMVMWRHGDTQGERSVTTKTDTGVMSRSDQEAGKDSPSRFGASVALPTPCFQTSGLQNWDRINVCAKPPTLWDFLMAALGHWYPTPELGFMPLDLLHPDPSVGHCSHCTKKEPQRIPSLWLGWGGLSAPKGHMTGSAILGPCPFPPALALTPGSIADPPASISDRRQGVGESGKMWKFPSVWAVPTQSPSFPQNF